MSLINCAKCKHNADRHPEYRGRAWADLPCASCEASQNGGDPPTGRTMLVEASYFSASVEASINERAPDPAEKLRMLVDLVAAMRDTLDVRIVQHLSRRPTDSFKQMAAALGVDDKTVAARVRRLRVKTN